MIRARPSEIYHHRIREGLLSSDAIQESLLPHFDALYLRVLQELRNSRRSWLQRFFADCGERIGTRHPVNGAESSDAARGGMYLHGKVGRGKSLLMTMLRESLPENAYIYLHFHQLMARVHQHLRALEQQRDPIPIVVERLLSERILLLVDEFVVVDIADAMLMANLLEALFARGAMLVTSSNFAPDELYRDGLQRARFVPAIRLIEHSMRVLEFADGIDYRRSKLMRQPIFFSGSDSDARARLTQLYIDLVGKPPRRQLIDIGGRDIEATAVADDVAWFHFEAICGAGRSRIDYQELALNYRLMFIDGLDAMADGENDWARRFIHLIDILYESKVKIVLSSRVPMEQLYQGSRLSDEFARTSSRLIQMCTADWLALPHPGVQSQAVAIDGDRQDPPPTQASAQEAQATPMSHRDQRQSIS